MNGARRLRSEQYMEGYARCTESKRVDWNVGGNVVQMWKQAKRTMLTVQERCVV